MIVLHDPYCNGRWGGGVCGSWGKRSHLGSRGARPAGRGKWLAVSFRQWRRRDIARWPKTQETGLPHLQEMFMHRVSVIVHCTYIRYNHNRNLVPLYYLFQENKSFGTDYHLHSSSDAREVLSSTLTTCMTVFCIKRSEQNCSRRSRRGRVQEDKRMAYIYTHGLFIT